MSEVIDEEMSNKTILEITHTTDDLKECPSCHWKTIYFCTLGECMECCKETHFTAWNLGERPETNSDEKTMSEERESGTPKMVVAHLEQTSTNEIEVKACRTDFYDPKIQHCHKAGIDLKILEVKHDEYVPHGLVNESDLTPESD